MILRYALELSIVIPALVFALMPVTGSLKYPSVRFFGLTAGVVVFMTLAGAYACVKYSLRTRTVLAVNVALVSGAYSLLVKLSMGRKLFCALNSVMMCEFCSIYSNILTAPYKVKQLVGFIGENVLYLPGILRLALALPVGAVFFRTLTVKIPLLLNDERIASVWRYMFLLPLMMALLVHWMTPISPLVVMTGRVRPIFLVLVALLIASAFILYHVFWWITARLTDSARLQQENTFLQMESKRYYELRKYMDYTRELRHDFRQHILVLSHFAESGQLGSLREYLSHLTEKADRVRAGYCANGAVDAVASHYDTMARLQDTAITWTLNLPAKLPMNEADYCAMLGNLLENALTAVKTQPQESRRVKVISSMLSEVMLGLSIDNPFTGSIDFGKNGLPLSRKAGHGTGLISVMNTVNRYGGNMNINAEENIFSVDIILYCIPKEE